jgi:hypothetical protein
MISKIIGKLYKFISNPVIAIIIITLFCLLFFIYNGYYNKNNLFFKFGPTQNNQNEYEKFLGTYLDSWNKVLFAYVIVFFTTIITYYYSTIMNNNITLKLIKYLNLNKNYYYIISLLDPIIVTLLYIIKFNSFSILQIQYVLPQVLGLYLISLPYLNSLLFMPL